MTAEAVLTVEQMRAAEQAAMRAGISEWELMRRAGEGAALWIARIAAGRAVTVLCGPGNNGGDGYVVAAALRRRGTSVTVVAPAPPATETARHARAVYGGEVRADAAGVHAPVLVDALFGYGLSRPLSGDFAQVLQSAAASHGFCIAIDVPSGVASDTGEVLGEVPQFELTLALGAWKQAHYLMPSMKVMGDKRLVPIGIGAPAGTAHLSNRPRLAAPGIDAHKYRRGLLAVVAGAMPGAPILAAQAAMRAGAGYVKLFSEQSHPDAPAELVIERRGLAEALADERISAVLVGPGLGRDSSARDRLAGVLASGHPAVVDADALHVLDDDLLEGVDVTALCLTPHEGELAQLCRTFGVTADTKLGRASAIHDVTGLTIVAKGPDTFLLGEGGAPRFFPRGSSWLSVAGTGDVLAGAISARLAGGAAPMQAAEEGVWLQHEAARIAGPAFTAGELASAIRPAIARLL